MAFNELFLGFPRYRHFFVVYLLLSVLVTSESSGQLELDLVRLPAGVERSLLPEISLLSGL